MGWMSDEQGLEKCEANYSALTPLSNLRRAALVYRDELAVVYGSFRKTFAEYHARTSQLASSLARMGIAPGDVVATLLPNIPAAAEAHFGVPACGAVLNTINTRLEIQSIAYILDHGAAKAVLVDSQFLSHFEQALERTQGAKPLIIEVPDPQAGYTASGRYPTYEDVLAQGDADFEWLMPADEWESIALNYTSGTTGRPKGVVYQHRGAYLNAMGQILSWNMVQRPHYLTIVPLFHCNGWCHTWMLPLIGGRLVCCRDITASAIFNAIADEAVTHFGGAPIVLNMLVNAPDDEQRVVDHVVNVFTAGAPPPPATLEKIEAMGFNVTHVYGLTEVFGPATECTWSPKLEQLQGAERSAAKARQGVAMAFMDEVCVMDSDMSAVPRDAQVQGEIMLRGNAVMKGYYKDPEATRQAFAGGYFHSGDIAVQHADGYVQIADRAKDIIISGGENISSVEVEGVLMDHPDVLLAAVVAKPDAKWGEVPCAFVELKDGCTPDEADIIAFARKTLAGFKTPKKVIFGALPKTSTGKVQKYELRKIAAGQ